MGRLRPAAASARRGDLGSERWCCYTPLALALGLVLGFLHVHRNVARRTGLPPWISLLLHCCSGELFFRGLAAESAREAHGPHSGSLLTKCSAVWAFTLQQEGNRLSTGLRGAGRSCGFFYGRAWRRSGA